jgi:hypothetical protein
VLHHLETILRSTSPEPTEYDRAESDMIPKGLWIPALGAAVGLVLCWMTGFLLVAVFNPPDVKYVGPGLDRWNLPGTILGLIVWLGASFYWMKRYR